MTTAERIKQRRKELGIRAEDVAAKAGVSRSTMFRYESGEIEKLPYNILSPIAEALHTTVEYLLFGYEDEQKDPTPENEDGLSEDQQYLIEAIHNMSPENVKKLRVIVEQVIDERGR